MPYICRYHRATAVAVAITAGAALGHPVAAAPSLEETVNDPTVTDFDNFGGSVALDGDNVLVGAPGDNTQGSNVGQAHLFNRKTGNLEQTFNDPSPSGSGTFRDEFGSSVALDGDNVLVGAPRDNTQGDSVGQAHLFDGSTGDLQQTFNDPTVTGLDNFGVSVALDGNNVLIGARFDDTQGDGVGQAHLFDGSTGDLQQTFNDPTPSPSGNLGDAFGSSVMLDGDNVLIGAPFDETQGDGIGQAHLFHRTTGKLEATFNDPTVTGLDRFGISVALDGNNVLIGAQRDNTQGDDVGQAHLFDRMTGKLEATFNDPTMTNQDNFGSSVAVDGNNILIGAETDNTQGQEVGQAHLFSTAEPCLSA